MPVMTPRRLTPVLLTLLAATVGFIAPAAAAGPGDEARLITRNADGAWFLQQPEGSPGKGCVARFTSAKKERSEMALVGPTATSATAAILMNGPRIATPASAQQVSVELQQEGLPSATMRGVLMPGARGGAGFLMIPVGDLKQTMASMRPKETGMTVRVDGVDVFRLSYDGLDQARSAMLDCLAGRRFTGGKSLAEATAEIRLVGSSTITGTAFYKGAVLAKKQYPPKGSQTVGLIYMSDEFKQWFDMVKQSQKMPDQIPERIAKHFMFATIEDDQGSFRFTRIPAGEYLLIADFSYKETVTRSEVVGRTDVFAGNRYIGSNDQVAYWFEDVRKKTTFSKTVHLKDGEAMQVTLDKSLLGCFLICR